jgi:hypothetical protein
MRHWGRDAALGLGRATTAFRSPPDFIMVGAQRAGTTSLFRALMSHPQVMRPTVSKGVNYFDLNYHRGWNWYLGHFPVARAAEWRTRSVGEPAVFEASGYYLYHPFTARRMAADLPGAKLVVMLRDPVERAYSAYQHEKARGFEWETFDEALRLEDQRLVGELDRMRRDPTYESFSHRHHSYLHRGRYAEQLERLYAFFPREQVHVMMSESFFADPATEFRALLGFLGLQQEADVPFERYNAQPRGAMPEDTRLRLRDHYAPHDEALTALLGRPLPWATAATGA